jgi:hypothetical protein
MDETMRHQCMIYRGSPAEHLRGLAQLIVEKLEAKNRCLYLNSPSMVAGVRSYLAAAGLDVAQQVSKGSLVLSSATDHLLNGHFDVERMLEMLSIAVEGALSDGYQGLWATGDMTWEFGGQENFDKLLAYECGLEVLFRSQPALSGICQYHQDTLPEDSVHVALSKHRAVFVNETLSRVNPFYSRTEQTFPQRLSPPTTNKMLAQPHVPRRATRKNASFQALHVDQ